MTVKFWPIWIIGVGNSRVTIINSLMSFQRATLNEEFTDIAWQTHKSVAAQSCSTSQMAASGSHLPFHLRRRATRHSRSSSSESPLLAVL